MNTQLSIMKASAVLAEAFLRLYAVDKPEVQGYF